MEAAKTACKESKQAHILERISVLEGCGEKQSLEKLTQQISKLDLKGCHEDFLRAMNHHKELTAQQTSSATIEPPVKIKGLPKKTDIVTPLLKKTELSREETQILRDKGLDFIGAGKLACLLLAGGQGTRLGYEGPKGCYKIGLPSGKTIFQLHVEKLRSVIDLARNHSRNASATIPFYIMTSCINHEATVKFFEEHKNFGLQSLEFFEQKSMPCFDFDGNMVLDAKDHITTSPNGNGGVFKSLETSGILSKMEQMGVEAIHIFGVDNVLARCADPEFVGAFLASDAPCGNKCCTKRDPSEPVGVMVSRKKDSLPNTVAVPFVVEYTELTKEQAESVDDDKNLLYSAGNICNHLFKINFLRDLLRNPQFEYHVAFKKIPYWDANKTEIIKPSQPNGVKLEYFIFDAFLSASNCLAFEVDRTEEFSPVKNVTGVDSPKTAVQDMSNLAKKLAREHGISVSEDDGEDKILEISPLADFNTLPRIIEKLPGYFE